MTKEKFNEIMTAENPVDWDGDNAFEGLKILSKYTGDLIRGADHDIVYSEDVNNLIEAGITEEDATKLRSLNWMIENDYLAVYV